MAGVREPGIERADHTAPSVVAPVAAPGGELLEGLSSGTVLSLQRTAGNRAVGRLLTGANGAKLARTPPEQGAKPSKPVKAAARAMAFTTPAAQVGELLVHFTGRLSIKGKAVLTAAELPKKNQAAFVSARLRELAATALASATPTGGPQRIELELGGERVTLELAPGAANAQPFIVTGRFTAEGKTLKFPGAEVSDAEITLEASAWIAPAPRPSGAPPTPSAASDQNVTSFTFAGAAANLSDEQRSGRVTQQTTMAGVQSTFEALEQRAGKPGSKIHAAVKKKIDELYGLPEQRAAWLAEMHAYFGSDAATLAHFAQIRPAKVYGGITLLHEEAASRLEAVQAELGEANMPRSGGVGWPRRECSIGGKQDLGSLHQIGYAVDYNAYGTPHLKDRRQLDLISVVTGRSAQMNLGKDHVATINELDVTKGTSPEKQAKLDALLDTVQKEFDSMAQANETFRTSLTTPDKDLGAELQELRKQWFDEDTDDAERAGLMEKAQAAMAPWFQKVSDARRKTDTEVRALGIDPAKLPSGTALGKARSKAAKLTTQLPSLRSKLAGKVSATLRKQARNAIARARALIGEAPLPTETSDADLIAELERLETAIATFGTAAPKKAWLDRLDLVADGLRNDPALVFGKKRKAVGEPGMAQLADTGWFSVKPNASNSEAFDADFFKTMVKHGFNPLATSSHPDSMHFELRWKGPASP